MRSINFALLMIIILCSFVMAQQGQAVFDRYDKTGMASCDYLFHLSGVDISGTDSIATANANTDSAMTYLTITDADTFISGIVEVRGGDGVVIAILDTTSGTTSVAIDMMVWRGSGYFNETDGIRDGWEVINLGTLTDADDKTGTKYAFPSGFYLYPGSAIKLRARQTGTQVNRLILHLQSFPAPFEIR